MCDPATRPGHTVGGTHAPGQVLIHPVSSDLATVVTRVFSSLPYYSANIAFAMADGAVHGSNGVELSLELLDESGRSIWLVPPTKVSRNEWAHRTVDLSLYVGRRVTLRLKVDALGKTGYDWLEVQLTMRDTG